MTNVKDWVARAAEELASHFSFGGGRDSYVTDEQRQNVANNYAAIIRKHCPKPTVTTISVTDSEGGTWVRQIDMKPDVAYMPVPRCETCEHWAKDETEVGAPPFGDCWLSEVEGGKMQVVEGRGIVQTEADFGCVQWKERP